MRSHWNSLPLWVLLLGVSGYVVAAPPKKPATKTPPAKPPTGTKPTPAPPPKPAVPSPAWAVAFSPNGQTLAVGSYKKVLFFKLDSGEKIAEWSVADDAVRALAYSPDGKWLAVGAGVPGGKGVVKLCDAANGNVLRTLQAHEDTVESVAFDGNKLLSAADDERIIVTDATTGQKVQALTEHVGRCLSVTVPKNINDAQGGALFASGGADKMLKIWDANLRRVVVNFDQCGSPVWAVCATPNPGQFVAGAGDGSVRIFQVNTVTDQKSAPPPGEPTPRTGYQARDMRRHEGPVYAVAADSQRIYSGGEDGKVIVWNYGGGVERELTEAKGDIWALSVSPDGKWLAAASRDGKARVYMVERGILFWELPFTPPPGGYIASSLQRGKGTGLSGSYFTNKDVTGDPAFSRVDAAMDLTFTAAPVDYMMPTNWSARWEGFIEAPATGPYQFVTKSDDGIRLWVNGIKLVDSWVSRGPTEDPPVRQIYLKEGERVPIKIEFFQDTGGAEVHLSWFYPGQVKQIVPTQFLYPKTTVKPK
ncbi:MAG: PA14 domain-containing protein [Armatimonas sp.]